MGLVIHIDGGSRGNPGPAGAGVVIAEDGGRLVHEGAYFLGRQTNNAAEYYALIRALQRAENRAAEPLTVHSDSELLVRQLTGEYRVKSPALQPLFEQAQVLLLRFNVWKVRHVRREQNTRADELANLAMDRANDVIVFDIEQERESSEASPTRANAPGAEASARAQATSASAPASRGARVTIVRRPDSGQCPAEEWNEESFCVGNTLPCGVCVHAAHALLPTILAILGADAAEFAAIPTMTVRCTRRGCDASFHVGPELAGNGKTNAES